ncbi:hypothetical protein ACFPAF_09595 [Hymenobacter endophyticus]|uniref:Uncharacterized protein n=1 Tax=Hymenobacter endophyticus TaxID=3076335 RepID=A0ABU3TGZ6_9BACT|nr:hypothetical protein [Hymenobacter endophyticus]MDU0370644.1 hypothetical protein [Hymenobacter endophyticus]
MPRTILLGLLLTAAATTALAQTTPTRKPAPARTAAPAPRPQPTPAKPASDGQGEYVAPDMTGAPNDRVTTDYSNRPFRKPAKGTSTLSSQPKSAPVKKPQ